MTNYLAFKTNTELSLLIANWVAEQRLMQNRSQAEISRDAGINSSTYKRFEQTGAISLERLIAILRTLNRLDALESILNSHSQDSPMDKLKGSNNHIKRQRARVKKV